MRKSAITHPSLIIINKYVMSEFKLDENYIQTRSRERQMSKCGIEVVPHQVVAALARDKLKMTSNAIGRNIGRSHATILNSFKVIDDLRTTNKKFKKYYSLLKTTISLTGEKRRKPVNLYFSLYLECQERQDKEQSKEILKTYLLNLD